MREMSLGGLCLALQPGNGLMFVFLHPAHCDERVFAPLHELGCDVLFPVRSKILQLASKGLRPFV